MRNEEGLGEGGGGGGVRTDRDRMTEGGNVEGRGNRGSERTGFMVHIKEGPRWEWMRAG